MAVGQTQLRLNPAVEPLGQLLSQRLPAVQVSSEDEQGRVELQASPQPLVAFFSVTCLSFMKKVNQVPPPPRTKSTVITNKAFLRFLEICCWSDPGDPRGLKTILSLGLFGGIGGPL